MQIMDKCLLAILSFTVCKYFTADNKCFHEITWKLLLGSRCCSQMWGEMPIFLFILFSFDQVFVDSKPFCADLKCFFFSVGL